jgi:4-amino-4-deoxy-L-arabinose transferase-like glycosyltransferase
MVRRVLRGKRSDPAWVRPALLGLLALTALLYLAGLGRNGWANDFYAAAVEAGTKSWQAFFFGSFDASNFITVDKTPLFLWPMEISARIFGLNSWSLLVPQALEGVASVGILYAAVRRWFGPAAGILSGLVLAVTPVAALMFRFDNPDAMLTLLMTAAAYAVVRAIEAGRTRWLVLAGVLIGFAFLSKMLQAFLVVPGLALAYLWAGPPRLGKRIGQLLAAGAGIVAGAGWWVAIAELTPASSRPYFGGSTNNNILQLALGYNGLGRITGNETGAVGPGRAGGGMAGGRIAAGHVPGGGAPGGAAGPGGLFGGGTGTTRMFSSTFGGQISWLLPAALISLAVLLWMSRRAVRTDRTRAAALLWGGWLLVTAGVFSYMSGIIHPYYVIALAPAIAALTGIGAVALWRSRAGWPARLAGAAAVAVTAAWAYALLDRTPSWNPWLRPVVATAGAAAAVAILAAPRFAALARTRRGRLALAGVPVGLALIAVLTGPVAYSAQTVATTHTGAIPTAGPAGGQFGAGGPGGGFGRAQAGGAAGTGTAAGGTGTGRPGGFGPAGTRTGTAGPGGTGTAGRGVPGAAPGGGAGAAAPGGAGAASPGGGTGAARPGGGPGGAGGGLGGNIRVSSALRNLLTRDASRYTWVAATEGSEEAAPLELATGDPVMSIGGFNGTDPAPTLAQFQQLVARHEIHYYVGRGASSFGGGSGSSAIATWVAQHFKSETVGGQTVYDLTQPT